MMNIVQDPVALPEAPADEAALDCLIAELIGDVYQAAQQDARLRLLDHLLRPLGALAVLGVAQGVFASVQFRRTRQDVQIEAEDLVAIRRADVVSLVRFVQQASIPTVCSLAELIQRMPAIASTGMGVALVGFLHRRAAGR